jgi:hypothetical protein
MTTLPKLGHDFVSDKAKELSRVDATCVEKGSKTVQCSRCEKTDDQELPIDADNHDWETEGTVTKQPTCTEKGVLTFKCKRTGCTETKTQEIDLVADAHKWDEGEITTPATCNAKAKFLLAA